MKIKVNGKETEVESGMTVLSLLESLGINPAAVVVEYNYEIPEVANWRDIRLGEGDNLEIVKFMGGG